jgi:excisionase family DNA binding protein
MNQAATTPGVLTLTEAAGYLRLPRRELERLAREGSLPGRQVGKHWRFLKAALDDWLRGCGGRAVLLQQAGALAGDETLPRLREMIYAQRGRPEAE